MAKVSLKGKKSNEDEVTDVTIVDEESSVSTLSTQVGGTGVSGDWGEEDLRIPFLQVVAKTGKLSDEFTPGTYVFDKSVPLTDPKSDKELLVIFLSARPYFMEDLPFDEEIRPRIFSTREEVAAAGLSLEWNADAKAKKCCSLQVLIPVPDEVAHYYAPDELHEGLEKYGFKLDGEPVTTFARAIWNVSGSAFNSVAKEVFTATKFGVLRENIFDAAYRSSFIIKSDKKNSWVQPTIRPAGRLPEDVRKWIAEEIVG